MELARHPPMVAAQLDPLPRVLLFDPRATRLLQRFALLALVELSPFPPLHLLLVDLDAVSARDTDGDARRYGIVFGDRERFEVGERDGVVRYVGPGEDYETAPNLFELTVRARDAFGGEARAEVTVEVTEVNEAPEAADDEAVTVDVLANDTDREGDRPSVRSVTTAAHGHANDNALVESNQLQTVLRLGLAPHPFARSG